MPGLLPEAQAYEKRPAFQKWSFELLPGDKEFVEWMSEHFEEMGVKRTQSAIVREGLRLVREQYAAIPDDEWLDVALRTRTKKRPRA